MILAVAVPCSLYPQLCSWYGWSFSQHCILLLQIDTLTNKTKLSWNKQPSLIRSNEHNLQYPVSPSDNATLQYCNPAHAEYPEHLGEGRLLLWMQFITYENKLRSASYFEALSCSYLEHLPCKLCCIVLSSRSVVTPAATPTPAP